MARTFLGACLEMGALQAGIASQSGEALAVKMEALASGGEGKVNLVVFGDSVTEGAWASTTVNRYPNQLAVKLRLALGLPASTARFYHPNNYLGLPADWTFTGATGNFSLIGLGTHTVQVPATATATVVFTGTGFDLHYAEGVGTGSFTYTVDGGAPVPIDTAVAKSFNSTKLSVSGLAPGSHTVVVTGTLNTTYLEGLYAYDGDQTTGLHVYNGGVAGWRLADYNFTSLPQSMHQEALRTCEADAVIFACGLNDYGSLGIQRTLAQLIGDIREAVSLARVVDPQMPVFFVIPHERPPGAPPDATWSVWRKTFLDEAARHYADVIDVGTALGSFVPPGNPNDSGDQIHLNDTGMGVQSSVITAHLLNLRRGPKTIPGVDLGVPVDMLDPAWVPNGTTVLLGGGGLDDGSPVYTIEDANSVSGVAPLTVVNLTVGERYRAEIMLKPIDVVVTAGSPTAALQLYNTDFSGHYSVGYSVTTLAATVLDGGISTEAIGTTSLDPRNPGWRRLQIEFIASFPSVYMLVFPANGALTDLSTITVSRPRVTRIY